ncbi:hypothetical protein HYS31_00690 [Candidatus Woesearchaeota archaeon]|nr:hypothetical protein [Candidatus Woesearchaeota archaeon]
MEKKAQSGMNAAILVAIIAGLIVLYIVFLPTSERERLVLDKGEEDGAETQSNLLLDVFPGTLSISKGLENEKPIPNLFLIETTNAMEFETINPFIIRNGWFDKKSKSFDFSLDDPSNVDNVILSFTTKKRQGILTIRLNNEVVFENEFASDIVAPVRLSKRLLDKANTLQFSVSSVGARFWATNEYEFENAKIIGDITDTSRQESSNVFVISDSEYQNMEKAELKFNPYCGNVRDLGALNILINNKKLVSSVPKCDDPYNQPIPKSVLNSGENNIVFKTDKGSYGIEQIRVTLDFKGAAVKTYYFEIKTDDFQSIRSNSRKVMLMVKFADGKTLKRAKLDVNSRIETIETDKMLFSKDITGKISEGNNFVRLEPLEDIEVVELKVELA